MMVIKNINHITASTLITLKQMMVLNVNNSLLKLNQYCSTAYPGSTAYPDRVLLITSY